MNSVKTIPCVSSSPCSSSSSRFLAFKCYTFRVPQLSFSAPKRRRSRRSRRPTKTKRSNFDHNIGDLLSVSSSSTYDDQNLRLILDVNRIHALASSRFHWLLDSGREACSDLRNLITLDDDRRVVVSCRKSTVQFIGVLIVLGFVVAFAVRVLGKLGSAFKRTFESKPKVVVRRDRSLGGKEVVVAIDSNNRGNSRELRNSILSGRVSGGKPSSTRFQVGMQQKLPKWWPISLPGQSWVVDKEDYQREANRLIRVIMDNRTSGEDIMEDDIVHLRRVCRAAGIRVSIDPINVRDSFYRTSVDFVLRVCSSAPLESTFVEIDGEDAREFVAGLAENIGLENLDAARMVSAAVAARTRSWFLQAWALEIQGKRSGSLSELSKICLVHRVFPPEESSPEMEMVARGLEKLMKVEEREFLLKTFVGVCGEGSRRSAAEALGLLCW